MGLTSGFFSLFGFNSTNRAISTGNIQHVDNTRESGILSLQEYWQNRQTTYADEWTFEVRENAAELIRRVNLLLRDLNIESIKVTSGWRPREINKRIGGAARSYHITGQAVDLRDNDQQAFSELLIKNQELLHRHQLWLENPRDTRGNTNWVHLDIGTRKEKDLRVFNS